MKYELKPEDRKEEYKFRAGARGAPVNPSIRYEGMQAERTYSVRPNQNQGDTPNAQYGRAVAQRRSASSMEYIRIDESEAAKNPVVGHKLPGRDS